jgi:hypothetical protein
VSFRFWRRIRFASGVTSDLPKSPASLSVRAQGATSKGVLTQ